MGLFEEQETQAPRHAASMDEIAQLRRSIADLRGSLSWRITAPLRWVSKPIFRARAPKPIAPQPAHTSTAPGLLQNGRQKTHEQQTTRIDPPSPAPPITPAATATRPNATGVQTNRTVDAICKCYGVGATFAHGVLEMLAGAGYDRDIGDVPTLLDRYPNARIYFDYALSTNTRGRRLANQLKAWGVPVESPGNSPKTYLDIGFAYGGCLAAFSQLGYTVTGVEISEKFGRLGRLNLESSGHAVDTRIGDFLSDEVLKPEPNQFDLITCTDVIEHVMDPETCLKKICRILKPGGVAYVAYPTKLSMPYVRADGHFQLFGLTLLDYFRARAACFMYTGWPDYEVSDYYEPEWYLNTTQSAGLRAELVYDDSAPQPDVPGEIALLYTAFSEWDKSASSKLDPLMRHEIKRELAKYSARMFQAYSEHLAHNSIDQFARKWIDPLTRILITKPLT